jgi:hypothetical protein
MTRALTLVALLAIAPPALAARYAIVIGNNAGHGMDAPLKYAESDAKRLAAVLREVGNFDPARVQLLSSPTVERVEQAFSQAAAQIDATHDLNALLLFYYSGHADGSTLHLAGR